MQLKPATKAFVMIRTTCVPSPSGGGTGWGCNCELYQTMINEPKIKMGNLFFDSSLAILTGIGFGLQFHQNNILKTL